MLTQIWSARTDIVFVISGQVLLFLINITCTANVWFLRYEVEQTKLFCHLEQFFALLPFNSMKNQNTKNEKQPWTYQDIIILHKCTKNHDHPLCCSWDVVEDGCICYFHFGLYFFLLAPLPPFPPNSSKNENFKSNEKNPLEISSFYISVQKNHYHMLYCPREMAHVRCNCYFFIFGYFYSFTPLTAPKNQNHNKMKNLLGDIIVLHKGTNNCFLILHCF